MISGSWQKNVLANNKADNYNKPVKNLLLSYHKLHCIMPLKIVFLNYHQGIFPENFGALNNGHGKCFIMIPQQWRRHIRTNGVYCCWWTVSG